MEQGFNMGRKSPWNKNEYIQAYKDVVFYAKTLYLILLKEEGEESANEALPAYNMLKYPIVYLFIHYHYGTFEDLQMDSTDISGYMLMCVANTKTFIHGVLDGLLTQNVFYYDKEGKISQQLIKFCQEILYIEDNF